MGRSDKKYYVFSADSAVATTAPPSSPTLSEVGGKALSLYEASAKSFPVPPGFVLTVAFFEPWLGRIRDTDAWKNYSNKKQSPGDDGDDDEDVVTKEDCDAIMGECTSLLSLDEEQWKLLEEAAKAAFGEDADPKTVDGFGIVAVRSSSPEEDLAGTSFAGGYETTLGVTSSTLERSIVHSFASLFDHRIHIYKKKHGMDPAESPRIAVVVQRQIASESSGVGFSINPANNCYDEIAISANFGLGESVVGGTVTPDTYIVNRFDPKEEMKITSKKVAEKKSSIWLNDNASTTSENGALGGTREEDNKDPTAQALTDEQVLEVARLVVCAEEKLCGGGDMQPVDIEWAFCDGKLYLLQARPVTAYVPLFPEMLTKRGEEKRLYLDIMIMTQGFSDPLSTLGLDLWGVMLTNLKPMMSTEGRGGIVWNLHGRNYMNISNTLMMTGGKTMVDKSLRSYDKNIDRAFSSIKIEDYTPSKVPEGAKGVMWKQLRQLGTMMPTMFSGMWRGGDAMKEYIEGCDAILEKCYNDECPKDESFAKVYEELVAWYCTIMPYIGGLSAGLISRAILHNWTFSKCKEEDVHDHLINMCMDLNGNPTSEMGHAMVRLAAHPEIVETESGEAFLRKLKDGSCSKEFMAEYETYLKKFGCRGIREIDAATPRMLEDQSRLFQTLKGIDVENNQITNVRERRDEAYQALLKIAKDLGSEKQFIYHASIIQSLMGYREHPKYMLVVIVARMRRHALKIAEDFVAQGRLENTDQIFDLTIDQVTVAQEDSEMELLPLVRANTAPVKKVAHVKDWPKLIDSRGKILRGLRAHDAAEDGMLLGDPISPGTVGGRAKVLHSPHEKPVLSGEILVARFTEPSWTPLFVNAAGVVMEIGGPMQHGAIIAREYGIPCVSGIEGVMGLIKDGDLLEVDGSSGTVKIIDEGDEKQDS